MSLDDVHRGDPISVRLFGWTGICYGRIHVAIAPHRQQQLVFKAAWLRPQ